MVLDAEIGRNLPRCPGARDEEGDRENHPRGGRHGRREHDEGERARERAVGAGRLGRKTRTKERGDHVCRMGPDETAGQFDLISRIGVVVLLQHVHFLVAAAGLACGAGGRRSGSWRFASGGKVVEPLRGRRHDAAVLRADSEIIARDFFANLTNSGKSGLCQKSRLLDAKRGGGRGREDELVVVAAGQRRLLLCGGGERPERARDGHGLPENAARDAAAFENVPQIRQQAVRDVRAGRRKIKKRRAEHVPRRRAIHSGEKRLGRIGSAIASWDFDINKEMKLKTSAGFKYSNYGTSALGWSGNAADPRPDYYKKLPSSIFNVYDKSTVPSEDELNLFNEVTERWKTSKSTRQIDWDQMYFANQQANALGKETLYYQEERHNDQLAFNFSSIFNHTIDQHNSYVVGLAVNTTKGMHYKKMKDLLGGDLYTDVDKFSVRDYGYNSYVIQNDLDNPNRRIGEGDKFGYDYNIFVNKQNVWARYQGDNDGHFNYFVSGKIGSAQISRDGKMRNGRAPKKSLGSSGTAKFLEGAVKAGFTYSINGNHSLILNAGYENRAPLAYNSFIAPRIKNDFAHGLRTEKIYNGELTYRFNTPIVSGRVTGYYTRFNDQVEMDAFYNDNEARFTYLSMSGIDKENWGVEAAATFKLMSNLSLTAIGTWSDARYMNNPTAVRTYESESESNIDRVYCKGLRDNGTPLSVYSLGLDYSVKGWFFNVTGNYYHRVYLDFSTYRRLGSVLGKYSDGAVDANGNPVGYNVPEQEELNGGFMLDASIGKYIRLKNGKSLSINLSVNNILNNTNLRTGGYEQNRDDSYDDGEARTYVFSKNSKYYYAPACNAFLNIGYRF